jgi:glycosyltransferase involved in cell wall biosynthesis
MPLQDPPAFVARYRTDKWMSWSRYFNSVTGGVLRLLAELVREGWTPDVLLAHSTAWAGVLAGRAGQRFELPVVIVEHSCPWLLDQYTAAQRLLIRQALADATTVCAVSPALRRLMLAHDLPDSIRWEIVGNLVHEAMFHPPSPRKAPKADCFRILTVANRTFKKDVMTLFRAAAIIRAQRPQLRFSVRVVGDFRAGGPTFSELAAECGIEDLVTADYCLGRADTAQAMREADLFVSPSIAETFGIVMAEALACGVPVVAARSGGAEYILGEDSPFLVEPREPEALARKVCERIDGGLPFDAEHAVQSITGRFGSRAFAARMDRILLEAVERHKVSLENLRESR